MQVLQIAPPNRGNHRQIKPKTHIFHLPLSAPKCYLSAPKCYASATDQPRPPFACPRLLAGVHLCQCQLFPCCQNPLLPPTTPYLLASPFDLARLALPQLGSPFPPVPGIPRGPATYALPLAVAAQRPGHYLAGLFIAWPALAVPCLYCQPMLHFSPDSPTPCPVPSLPLRPATSANPGGPRPASTVNVVFPTHLLTTHNRPPAPTYRQPMLQ
jgi:hypothetical protein